MTTINGWTFTEFPDNDCTVKIFLGGVHMGTGQIYPDYGKPYIVWYAADTELFQRTVDQAFEDFLGNRKGSKEAGAKGANPARKPIENVKTA
jgi:hypothetical protein